MQKVATNKLIPSETVCKGKRQTANLITIYYNSFLQKLYYVPFWRKPHRFLFIMKFPNEFCRVYSHIFGDGPVLLPKKSPNQNACNHQSCRNHFGLCRMKAKKV